MRAFHGAFSGFFGDADNTAGLIQKKSCTLTMMIAMNGQQQQQSKRRTEVLLPCCVRHPLSLK